MIVSVIVATGHFIANDASPATASYLCHIVHRQQLFVVNCERRTLTCHRALKLLGKRRLHVIDNQF